MADFLLSVGVDVGLSYDQMQKDISTLVSQLNGNPPKIKVALDIDSATINQLRTQISDISKTLQSNSSVNVSATGASKVAADMSNVATNARNAANATRTANTEFKQTDKEVKKLTLGSKEYYAALKQIQTLLTQVTNNQEKWTAAKTGKSSGAYSDLSTYATELTNLISQVQSGTMSVDDFNKRMAELSSKVATANGAIKAAGENTQTWAQRVGNLSAKFGTWFNITRVIMAAYRTVTQMVDAVIELDTAMTELKKVTNETDAAYAKFLDNATVRAKELGASLSDVVTASADFARLGYSISDAEKLADAAIIYKNVGDGIEDINTASESIIATMQAFGIGAEDAMLIVDKFNEVGNNYAISSVGVGEALLRSAAAMQAANNTLDETIALATAANTIVQDPEKVGTTLKTVSMYLRAAKTEAEEAGESTDGMANSVSELRDEILALTGNKVDIQIDEDTFKSTYQILQELSQVWGELTDISQANILEMVGGKRNSNVVAALLENFSVAENALKTAATSAGSALSENDKYLESINGKISQFKAAFEEMSQNFIGSDFVKGVVDFGTTLIEILNGVGKVVEALGGLNTVLTTTIGIIAILKAKSLETMLLSLGKKIMGVGETIAIVGLEIKDAFAASRAAGVGRMKSAVNGLSAGFNTLTAAATTAQLAIAAFVAVITVINLLKNAIEDARQEAIQLNEELYEKYQVELDQTAQLKEAYLVYNDYNSSLEHTAAEETAYQQAIKTVTDLIGDKEEALKYLTAGTEEYTEALQGATDAELDSAVTTAKQQVKAANDALKNVVWSWWDGSQVTIDMSGRTGIEEFVAAYKIAEEVMGEYFDDGTYGKELEPIGWDSDHENMDALTDYYYKLIELRDTLTERDDGTNNLMNNDIYEGANKIIGELESSVNKYVNAKFMQALAEHEADKGIIKTTEDLAAFRDALKQTYDYVPEDTIDTFLSEAGYGSLLSKLQKQEYEAEQIASKIKNIAETMLSDSFKDKDTNWHAMEDYLAKLEEYKTKLGELSAEDLEIASIVISEQDINSWEELTAAIDEYKASAKGATAEAKNLIESIWSSEDFADAKAELVDIAKTSGKISSKKIRELASESDELAAILEIDGMNAEFLANILTYMGQGYDGLALVTEDALKLNDALSGMVDEFDRVTAAKQRYDDAMSVEEKDTNFKSVAEAFKVLNDEFVAGTTNSNAFWAAAEFVFGSDQLATWGWEDGLQNIYDAMQQNVGIFEDAESAGLGFLDRLYEISESGKVLDKDGNVLAEITKLADGGFDFSIDYESIDGLADKMNLSEEAIISCIEALSMWADIDFYNIEEVMETIEDIGLATEKAGKKAVNVDNLIEQLVLLGKTDKEIVDIIDELEALDDVKLISVDTEVNDLVGILEDLSIASSNGTTLEVDYVQLTNMMKELQFTKEEAQNVITKLSELDGVQFTNQLESGTGGATDVAGVMDYINGVDFTPAQDGVDSVTAAVVDLNNTLTGLNGKQVSVTVDIVGSFRQAISDIRGFVGFAGGTQNAPEGTALVGEEGEELVQSGDRAYFVGTDSPELVHLNKGDRVYTAEETKRIKKSAKRIVGNIPSFASGGVYGGISGKKWDSVLPSETGGSGGSSKRPGSGGKGSSGKSSSSSSSEKAESEFERLYKYHQHLLAMDAESVDAYLAWLNDAYQKAYQQGEIELDDYYKYQEEVYKGLKDLFIDHLDDVEHEISMRENYEGESDNIIALYKGLMKDIEKEIAAARAQGLDDTDDYIQDLQSRWQDYGQAIADIETEATDNAKDAIDELIEYRIDMLKQDIESEKDVLDKKLDYLSEFYDKQKEMLQDQYDEEQYLKEQAEKRKSVSDIQSEIAMLENDDSAWAQKRKLELQEELHTAQDDLGEFEDEHALDLALDALDNAYNAQEAQIQAEMDALEEKLNDPEALYNQALADIKNNTGSLYQEMLEFNRKYGTGNDEDVKDIYEEAYKTLLEYEDVNGKPYKGIILPNSTNYKPEAGSWDTEKISGTNPENKPKEKPKKKEEPKNTAPSLSKGSTITVKKSATHFGSKSNGVRMASFVPGGSYTVYQTSGNQVLIGRNGVYTGWINKSDIVGYAKGTKNATAGLHSLDELGSEYLFTSTDGNKYRVLSSGDKVLNARATDFLYEFANGGGEILGKIIKSAFGTSLFDHIQPVVNHNEIDMGDVIVQGSATQQTVSEIRRAQRDNLTEMLKSLNKLNK